MYTVPQIYHVEDHLCPVDDNKVMVCAEETVKKKLTCADITVFDLCVLLMEEHNWSKPTDSIEAMHLYIQLRQIIRSGLSNH